MNAAHLNRRGRRGGVVLMEVIMALTIFALVSLGLITALDRAFGIAGDRNSADQSVRGMRNQLALLHATVVSPGEKDIDPDSSGIAYHLSIAPEPMQDEKKQPVLGIYRATITATWKRDKQTETRTISQLIYQP
jgi:hypothetical protein